MSELHKRTQSYLAVPPVKFALVPHDRSWLHQRIEQRFRQMIDNGFMAEVQTLHKQERLHSQLPAMRSVGYRQAWHHLDKNADDEQAMQAAESEWVEKAVAATRQLAKRQLTWLRSMANVELIECDTQSLDQQLASILQKVNSH